MRDITYRYWIGDTNDAREMSLAHNSSYWHYSSTKRARHYCFLSVKHEIESNEFDNNLKYNIQASAGLDWCKPTLIDTKLGVWRAVISRSEI